MATLKQIFLGLAFGSYWLMPNTAQACEMYRNFEIDQIEEAGVVAIGRISDYELVADPKYAELRKERMDTTSTDYAEFVFNIDEVIGGNPPKKLQVRWHNSTFELPKSLSAAPVVIALYPPPAYQNPSPYKYRPALAILQEPCSSPFMLETTPENIARVKEALKKFPLKAASYDYSQYVPKPKPLEAKIASVASSNWLTMIVIAVALAFAAVLAALFWRKSDES
jgi:hypothetical protein